MLELSYEELDGYIQQICSGKKLIYLTNKSDVEIPLLFKYPSVHDIQIAGHVYRKTLKEAEQQGLPSVAELEEQIRKRGIFTEDDEAEIARLESRIEGQRAVLSKTTRVPARRDRLKEIIQDLEEQVDKIKIKRESSLSMARERKASEAKFLYLTLKGTFDPFTGEKFWKTETDFQDEADFMFQKKVFLEYIIFCHGLPQKTVRYVARSNLWRIRYITAVKTSDNLFGHSIGEYNVDQLTLLYWSHYYQSIYEMMSDDRPPETIVEDDEALDAYMKDWQADKDREATASRAKKAYGNKSAWDHNETLVMRSNPIHEDVEYSGTMNERTKFKDAKTIDAAPVGRNTSSSR